MKEKKEMKWGNLREFRCPYCDEPLEIGNGEVKCTACRFHTDAERFRGMYLHRGLPGVAPIRMKWQNLIDWRCPADNDRLLPTGQEPERYKCITCGWNRAESSILRIISDPTHVANRFHHGDLQHKK